MMNRRIHEIELSMYFIEWFHIIILLRKNIWCRVASNKCKIIDNQVREFLGSIFHGERKTAL